MQHPGCAALPRLCGIYLLLNPDPLRVPQCHHEPQSWHRQGDKGGDSCGDTTEDTHPLGSAHTKVLIPVAPQRPRELQLTPTLWATAGDTVTPQASDREQILGCCLMVPRVILLAVRMEVPVGWDGGGREVGTKGLHLPPPAPWGWQGEGEGSQGEGVNALLPCCCHLAVRTSLRYPLPRS